VLQFVQYRSVTASPSVLDPFSLDWSRLVCTFPSVPSDQVWRVERLIVQAVPTGFAPPNTEFEVYAYDEAPSATTTPLDCGFLQPHPIGPGGIPTLYAVSDGSPLVLLGGAQLTIWVPEASAAPSPGGGPGSLWLGSIAARATVAVYQGAPGAPQPVAGAQP
jgi:hypothetical protein